MGEINNNDSNDRDVLIRIKEQSENDFEKHITYISAGSLALSLSFISKIVPFENTVFIWCIILGWSLLTLTLAINLISHFVSKRFANKSLDEYDNGIDQKKLYQNIDRRNCITDTINITTIITLILGIISIILFVSLNLNNYV